MVIVPNRKAETLLSIIYEVVAENSTIVHDSWNSYNRITDFESKKYRTQRVNHKYNFADPDTGALSVSKNLNLVNVGATFFSP